METPTTFECRVYVEVIKRDPNSVILVDIVKSLEEACRMVNNLKAQGFWANATIREVKAQ